MAQEKEQQKLQNDLKAKYPTEEYDRIRNGLSHGGRRIAGSSSAFPEYEECWCSDCLYALSREPQLK